MFKIGCHLSAAKGYLNMGKEALSIGSNTFQFFTRNPRGGRVKAVDPTDAALFRDFAKENMFFQLVAHVPYTLNACAGAERIKKFTQEVMLDDLMRLEYIPYSYYNFHPGSHVGQGIDTGIELVAKMLNKILKPSQTTIVLLETMAGKGTELGSTFGELKRIIEKVELQDKLGVCLDTCHVYDAGYDIVNDLEGVIDEFDQVIGLDKLYAIHLNDSKNPFCSHKDRHEKIGQGTIGLAAITRVINHPRLSNLPFLLETPNELPGYAKEIALLKENYLV